MVEKGDNSPVSVSCASDENYYCGLLVTLHSLCTHAAQGTRLKIHVLDTGLLADSRNDLVTRLSEIPGRDVEVVFHSYDTSLFLSCPKWRGGYSAYARLALQDILKDEDWTIYTDIDTLWLRDVGELWAMRANIPVLAAVPDGSGMPELSSGDVQSELFASQGLKIAPASYFCSGLMVLNLKKLREIGFLELSIGFIAEHKEIMRFADQDVYNWFFQPPEAVMLDWRWGEFSTVYGQRDVESLRVIHYANQAPWKKRISRVSMLWWGYIHKNIKGSCFSRKAALNCFVFKCLDAPILFGCVYGVFWLFNRKYFMKRKGELLQ